MISYNTHAESVVSNLQAATKNMHENSCNSVTESNTLRAGALHSLRAGQGMRTTWSGMRKLTPWYEVRVMEVFVFRATVTATCMAKTDAVASDQRRRHASTQNIVLE